MKTVDMETEYELGQKMIDAIIKEKVAAGCVSFLFLLSFLFFFFFSGHLPGTLLEQRRDHH